MNQCTQFKKKTNDISRTIKLLKNIFGNIKEKKILINKESTNIEIYENIWNFANHELDFEKNIVVKSPQNVKLYSYYSNLCSNGQYYVNLFAEMNETTFNAADVSNFVYFYKRSAFLEVIKETLENCENIVKNSTKYNFYRNNILLPILSLQFENDSTIYRIFPALCREKFTEKNFAFKYIKVNEIDDNYLHFVRNTLIEDIYRFPFLQKYSIRAEKCHLKPQHVEIVENWICHFENSRHFLGESLSKIEILFILVLIFEKKNLSGNNVTPNQLKILFINEICKYFECANEKMKNYLNFEWSDTLLHFNDDIEDCNIFNDKSDNMSLIFLIDTKPQVNLMYYIRKNLCYELNHFAKDSKRFINSSCMYKDSTPINLWSIYDATFVVKHVNILSKTREMDSNVLSNNLTHFCEEMETLLYKGMSDRVNFIRVSSINFIDLKNVDICISLIFNDDSKKLVTNGPSLDKPQEIKDFKALWSPKSEMRRFKDGKICESVLWAQDGSEFSRKCIVPDILAFLLAKFYTFERSSILTFYNSLKISHYKMEPTKMVKFCKLEESFFYEIQQSFKALKKIVINSNEWNCINVANVLPIDSILLKTFEHVNILYSQDLKNITDSIKVYCELETTGKWPNDKESLCRIMMAYLIKFADILKKKYNLKVKIKNYSVDVDMTNGFRLLFSVRVAKYYDFIATSKRLLHCFCDENYTFNLVFTNEKMIKMMENKGHLDTTNLSNSYVYKLANLDKFYNYINCISTTYDTYCQSVRIIKRFLAYQMLSNIFENSAIELLIASLYIENFPVHKATSCFTIFMRFLKLMFSFDWKKRTLYVNFNDTLLEETKKKCMNSFMESKKQFKLSRIYILSSIDDSGLLYTKEKPSPGQINILSTICLSIYKQFINLKSEMQILPFYQVLITPILMKSQFFDFTVSFTDAMTLKFTLKRYLQFVSSISLQFKNTVVVFYNSNRISDIGFKLKIENIKNEEKLSYYKSSIVQYINIILLSTGISVKIH
ncbi:U3 small nucleolar RNA-associated protein 22 [Intoshia linei]|uniref:Nucleolar protein 6 n=1 Tax=Intoshia linei TaxID=1819745 RepID=A0A177AXT2_9BILA|nr:U3 small nucleolar RNA-associated protein 22 [Intoshia linei]